MKQLVALFRGRSIGIVPVIFSGDFRMNMQRQRADRMAGWGRAARRTIGAFALAALVGGTSVPVMAGLFDDTPSSSKPNQKPKAPLPPLDNNPATPSGDSTTGTSQSKTQVSVKPAAPPPKLPIPSDAARKAAEKQIRDIMGDDLAKARTPEEKTKIATQMLQTADGTSDPAGKYMLLRDAEGLAAEAGDVETAIAANSAVISNFQPDATSGAIEPLEKFTRLSLDADAEAKLSQLALSGLHEAIAANRFDVARQFGRLALAFAHRTTDHDLNEQAASALASITTCEAEYARVAPMQATLEKNPSDPSANAAIGRYECFVKGNWAVGLPMLAKGSNETLKRVAVDELKPPTTAVEQSAVADAWWGMTEGLPPAIQINLRAHAADLYARAEEGLSGLNKLKAEQRIAQMQPAQPKPQVVAETPKSGKSAKPADSDDTNSTTSETIEVNGPADVVKVVPPDMFPKSVTDWTEERQGPINDILRQKLYHQKGTFNLVVQDVLQGGQRVVARAVLFGKITFRLQLRFDADARSQALSMRVGQPCTVSGEIYYARFEGMALIVDMEHCTRLQ